MAEATLTRANGSYAVDFGSQRLTLDDGLVQSRPALASYEGRPVVVGIRPEHLEDAAIAPETPADRRLRGTIVLREALGSEIMAHFSVDARPALTEDVRELAQDLGDERAVQDAEAGAAETEMVGRFGARSGVTQGEVAEIAVDTRSLHFFDPETGLGVYDQTKPKEGTS
jgi:multiple sugar transport system ATP-binding protein